MIVNDGSIVILAKSKKGTLSADKLSESIYQHAEEHRNPYADWYLEEHGDEPCMSLYNKSNSKLVRDDLVTCFTLFDIFFAYVFYTKTHGCTPSNQGKVGIPWRQVRVNDVLEDFNYDLKAHKKVDKDTVLVHIYSEKLDKTTKAIFDHCDSENVSGKIPQWIDLYELVLRRFLINKLDTDPDYECASVSRELVTFCRETYSGWLKSQS